ncbi:hypothetical protein CDV31_001350 [Fusarium ambrosium]|uniref:Uncharacterized protein n=1 Tax=Fusarium ambrosium TaxID=131363 RepID=A0A428UZJ5_9HYPO|nr:hypothetical protein CDV31_001350 [Fusarium ambrosium]
MSKALLSSKGRTLIEDLLEVAGTVDDDVESLLHEILCKSPLKIICAFRYLVEWNIAVFKESGSQDIVVNDNPAN